VGNGEKRGRTAAETVFFLKGRGDAVGYGGEFQRNWFTSKQIGWEKNTIFLVEKG